jgi:hypothetical protein
MPKSIGTFTYEASLGESARHRRGCVTGDLDDRAAYVRALIAHRCPELNDVHAAGPAGRGRPYHGCSRPDDGPVGGAG